MKRKPIEHNKADVIFTTSYFTVGSSKKGQAYKGLVDYSQRERATDPTNDFDVLSEKIETEKEKEFRHFVDYSSRNTATIVDSEDKNTTATFNQSTDNLTIAETEILKKKLDIAQQNQAILWPSVLSFSTKFLIENNLYDPVSGHFDQSKTKAAIRNNMHSLIEENNLDSSAFWWGDIQFDTNHVHVHINMSEENPNRDKILFERKGKMFEEYKGNLTKKSIQSFKSHVTMDLIALGNPKYKNYRLNYEKKIGILKTNLKEDIKLNLKKNDLHKLMLSLPENRNLWRYGSRSKEMEAPRRVLDTIISKYLDKGDNQDYREFKRTLKQLDSYNSHLFGKGTKGRTFQNKDQELKERLGNQLLEMCKKLPPEEMQVSIEGLAKNYEQEDIEANLDAINFLKRKSIMTKSAAIKKELMIRKIGLKKQNANRELKRVLASEGVLKKIPVHLFSGNDKIIANFLDDRFKNRKEFCELKLRNPWELESEDKQKLNYLQWYFSDPVDIPVNKVNENVLRAICNRLNDEDIRIINLKNVNPELQGLFLNELSTSKSKDPSIKKLKKQNVLKRQLINQKFKIFKLKRDPNYSKEEAAKRYEKVKRINNQINLTNLSYIEKISLNMRKANEKLNVYSIKDSKKFKKQFKQQSNNIIKETTYSLKQQLKTVKQTKQKEKLAQQAMFEEAREGANKEIERD